MRGDSLRDFYAKTLALCGLALLAGVGALVDYWPVSRVMPDVAAAAELPRPVEATALPVRETTLPVAIVTPAPEPVYALALEVTTGAPVGTPLPVVLTAPPPAPEMAVVTAAHVPATALPLTVPEPVVMPTLDPVPIYQLASEELDSGFFADGLDAVKLTGNWIARGGAKTGTTIVDASVGAFRFVSGAFRKLKFF